MTEDFLNYIWQYQLLGFKEVRTTDGTVVKILRTGKLNTDAGPDFFNALIKIGDTTWAGNIEVHIKSSDWFRHKHDNDNTYLNVILHVVYEHDKAVFDFNGQVIPTVELKDYITSDLLESYERKSKANNVIICKNSIHHVNQNEVKQYLHRLCADRLSRKASEIKRQLVLNKNDWELTLFQTLIKYFGLRVNDLPFKLLSASFPLKIIHQHPRLLSIEALLFGQAGFLDEEIDNDYYRELKIEYQFLKRKFMLVSLDKSIWKLLRLRPANFPTIRIAQLAILLQNSPKLFSKIIGSESVKELTEMLSASPTGFWDSNYSFTSKSKSDGGKSLGNMSKNSLIINAIVPITYLYGLEKRENKYIDKANRLLKELKKEKNKTIRNWEKVDIFPDNAMESQGLIELETNYCIPKKCLNCDIGEKLFDKSDS